jgi:cytochrome c556
LISTVAVATDDPIATRQQLMQVNGASMGAAQAMAKGEVQFDERVAMAALQNFEAVGYSFGDYFPPGSDQVTLGQVPRFGRKWPIPRRTFKNFGTTQRQA